MKHRFRARNPRSLYLCKSVFICGEKSTGNHNEEQLRELPAISPFSFPIYASVIKESMMLEDYATALERIYHEMYAKLELAAVPSA